MTFITVVERPNRAIVVTRDLEGEVIALIVITGSGEQVHTMLNGDERKALVEALGGQA